MNKLTPEQAILALSKCRDLEETIDRLKIRLMKAARPKLELVKDDTDNGNSRSGIHPRTTSSRIR